MLSEVRGPSPAMRAMIEWTPQELLPVMPPSVHQAWVAGSGPNVSPWAAAEERRPVVARRGDRGDHVVDVAGDYYPEGRHPVVGGVGRVEGPAAGVEAHFAADRAPQLGRQGFRIHAGGALPVVGMPPPG